MKVIYSWWKRMTFFLKKLYLLFCPSYKGLGQKHSLNFCAAFSKMAKRGCRLQSRTQGLGLVRPRPQLSSELWVCAKWKEGRLKTSHLPPWTLWCSCMLAFWGLAWLTLPGLRNGTLLVSVVVPTYIYWRPTVCFSTMPDLPWQPYWACSWAEMLFMVWLLLPAQSSLPAAPHPSEEVVLACDASFSCSKTLTPYWLGDFFFTWFKG